MSIFRAPLRHGKSVPVKAKTTDHDLNDPRIRDSDEFQPNSFQDEESEHQSSHSESEEEEEEDDREHIMSQATSKENESLMEEMPGRKHRSLRYQHIDVLVTLLHKSILDADWRRAEQAYALLLRCKGIDIRLCYDLGLEILENIDSTGNKAAELLSRLIIAFPPIRARRGKTMYDRAEKFVPLLVEHRRKHGQYRIALQELDSWLLIPPYKDDERLWIHFTEICDAMIENATNESNREEVARLTKKKQKAMTHLRSR